MPSYENAVKFEKEAPAGVVRLVMGNGFYRAYNRSAWLFYCCIAEHKVTRKYVKNLGENVVYVGFPMDKLLERIGGREHHKTDFGYDVVLKEGEAPDDAGYAEWLEKVPKEPASRGDYNALPLCGDELCRAVCAKIRAFPIESKTLLETVAFMGEMRSLLLEERG